MIKGKVVLYYQNKPIDAELYTGRMQRKAIILAWRSLHITCDSVGYSIGIQPMDINHMEIPSDVVGTIRQPQYLQSSKL